jgi:hypothetical protein
MGDRIHAYSILVVKYKERYLCGDLGIDGGMQCNWVWGKKTKNKQKQTEMGGLDSSGSG